MCGEHTAARLSRGVEPGSSPHVRGTLHHEQIQQRRRRIIPACAGNTAGEVAPKFADRDHPRMCGEHQNDLPSTAPSRGSSPHVRGTPRPRPCPRPGRGIIPACAGNTMVLPRGLAHARDHPRMCGEHVAVRGLFDGVEGSSPHVRGTPVSSFLLVCLVGIIPACAGNTQRKSLRLMTVWDHPRMCGEHLSYPPQVLLTLGSSPHVRGTRHRQTTDNPTMGIIPACAGNTRYGGLHALLDRDHPRMCGEHLCLLSFDGLGEGSSPHVRGTPQAQPAYAVQTGIIPACAGNTLMSSRGACVMRDHPRMCGEHTKKIAQYQRYRKR